jgi:hypothetical protein
MNDQEKVRRARVRAVVKSYVWGLLVALGDSAGPVTRPLTAQGGDGTHEVVLTVAAAGAGGARDPAGGSGVLLLSPEESAVVNALGPGGSVNRKRLAALSGHAYGADFKCRVRGLLARRVLEPDPQVRGNLRWHPLYRALRGGATGG